MMSGTSHVSSRFSGSRSNAPIDSGAITASRAAVATTKAMSTNPITFQIEYAHHPPPPHDEPQRHRRHDDVAPSSGHREVVRELSPTVQDQEIDADEAREVKADQQSFVHGHHPGAQGGPRHAQERGHERERQQDGLRRRDSERRNQARRAHRDRDDQPHADGQHDRPGPISGVRHEHLAQAA